MTSAARKPEPANIAVNPSIAYSQQAESICRKQRLDLAKLLRLDESKVTKPEDLVLAKKVIADSKYGAEYDAHLADKAVGALFRRGVLRFGAAP